MSQISVGTLKDLNEFCCDYWLKLTYVLWIMFQALPVTDPPKTKILLFRRIDEWFPRPWKSFPYFIQAPLQNCDTCESNRLESLPPITKIESDKDTVEYEMILECKNKNVFVNSRLSLWKNLLFASIREFWGFIPFFRCLVVYFSLYMIVSVWTPSTSNKWCAFIGSQFLDIRWKTLMIYTKWVSQQAVNILR